MKDFVNNHGWDIARDVGVSVLTEVREEVRDRELRGWENAVRLGLDLMLRWVSRTGSNETATSPREK